MDSNMIRVAPSRDFRGGKIGRLGLVKEFPRLFRAPGEILNGFDRGKALDYRVPASQAATPQGVVGSVKGLQGVQNVANPDRADGMWDPFALMPDIVFDPREDAFPVDPAFDGDAEVNNNGPATPNGPGGSYQDGLIGGKQALKVAFAVTKKGDFYVATTSMYMATNKAGDYHRNDYATAQVYLKPGPDGKLTPAFLYTSWHNAGRLTKWEDLQLNAQGKPTVQVELGSHALSPLGPGHQAPEGLRLRGDGSVSLGGKLLLGQRTGVDALQSNVLGARILQPGSVEHTARTRAMAWGEAVYNPFLPEDFAGRGLWWELRQIVGQKAQGLWQQAKSLGGGLKRGLAKAWPF